MTTLEARFPPEAARPVRGRLGFDLGPRQFLASLKRDLLTKVATEHIWAISASSQSVLQHCLYDFQNMCYSEAFSNKWALKEIFDDRRQGARSAPPVGRAW